GRCGRCGRHICHICPHSIVLKHQTHVSVTADTPGCERVGQWLTRIWIRPSSTPSLRSPISTTCRWPSTSPVSTPCTGRWPACSRRSTGPDRVPRLARLDAELVRRGLARSRGHAGQLIADGRVTVAGTVARKAATSVGTDAAVQVQAVDEPEWASRGSHKLLGALAAFTPDGLTVQGRRCLDAGASTGGF